MQREASRAAGIGVVVAVIGGLANYFNTQHIGQAMTVAAMSFVIAGLIFLLIAYFRTR
ncbi:MAG: hypothetical protein Q3972_06965 [Corynebacterium sp.]|nr:hypothetical protein [Corynebacterium sp.]